MPGVSTMIMAAPMMMGPAPVNAAIEVASVASVQIPADHGFETPLAPSHPNVLALSWSLTSAQDSQDAVTPGGEETGQRQADQGESEIVVEGEYGPVERDPMGEFNETSYRITQDLDEVFLEPVAYAYRDGLPRPLRDGLGNVVRNLSEPTNFINFLLQFKFGKAMETLGRFAINSTLGIGGLIDMAGKPGVGLPYRRNGFANTLGFYGVEPGAYLYLPVTGATTVRDLFGNALNQLPLPVLVGKPFNTPEYTIPFFVISSLDARLEVDDELKRIDATVDPYTARRESYLWTRERDIALLKGEEVPPKPNIVREVDGEVDLDDEGLEGAEGETGDEPTVEPSDAPAIMGDAGEVAPDEVLVTQLR